MKYHGDRARSITRVHRVRAHCTRHEVRSGSTTLCVPSPHNFALNVSLNGHPQQQQRRPLRVYGAQTPYMAHTKKHSMHKSNETTRLCTSQRPPPPAFNYQCHAYTIPVVWLVQNRQASFSERYAYSANSKNELWPTAVSGRSSCLRHFIVSGVVEDSTVKLVFVPVGHFHLVCNDRGKYQIGEIRSAQRTKFLSLQQQRFLPRGERQFPSPYIYICKNEIDFNTNIHIFRTRVVGTNIKATCKMNAQTRTQYAQPPID